MYYIILSYVWVLTPLRTNRLLISWLHLSPSLNELSFYRSSFPNNQSLQDLIAILNSKQRFVIPTADDVPISSLPRFSTPKTWTFSTGYQNYYVPFAKATRGKECLLYLLLIHSYIYTHWIFVHRDLLRALSFGNIPE